MDLSSARGPFGFRLQSSSPVLGCLFTMLGLLIALALALIGTVAALIIRMVRRVLPKPAAVQVRHPVTEAIDVESTVLPPGSDDQAHPRIT